jgi:hypothetical protein
MNNGEVEFPREQWLPLGANRQRFPNLPVNEFSQFNDYLTTKKTLFSRSQIKPEEKLTRVFAEILSKICREIFKTAILCKFS